ncbi:MAG: hypothetical protein DMG05_05280 [Acidobacteria bacterium]|nr:MAG: hypothetical protein DMG05_05280 [Acidobacteriota bacterium]
MTRAYNTMKQLLRGTVVFLIALISAGQAQDDLSYTTYTSFNQVVASNLRPPRSAVLSATDPSPGLRPPSPIGRGAGGEGAVA